LLSPDPAFISNAIFEVERSFNPPSTASRLFFLHPLSFLYHYLCPRHPNRPSTTRYKLAMGPSPLLRDVGLITNATRKHTSSNPSRTCPSPSRGMWAGSCSLDGANEEGETHGGTQEVGGPQGTSRNTSHDVCRGSFSSSNLSIDLLLISLSPSPL